MGFVMLWKLIAAQITAFIVTLFLSKLIIKALQKRLSTGKYKLTQKFSYIIACLIMLIVGVIFGREALYTLL
jgi:hypothetical protein